MQTGFAGKFFKLLTRLVVPATAASQPRPRAGRVEIMERADGSTYQMDMTERDRYAASRYFPAKLDRARFRATRGGARAAK